MHPNNSPARKEKIQKRLDVSGFVAAGLGVICLFATILMSDVLPFMWGIGAFTVLVGWFVIRAVSSLFREDPILNGSKDK